MIDSWTYWKATPFDHACTSYKIIPLNHSKFDVEFEVQLYVPASIFPGTAREVFLGRVHGKDDNDLFSHKVLPVEKKKKKTRL